MVVSYRMFAGVASPLLLVAGPLLLVAGLLLLAAGHTVHQVAAATPTPASSTTAASTPVIMAAKPGTQLDRAARTLVAQDLAEAAQSGDKPLLLIGSARLGAATDRPALFVQLQSPRECGSAGCSTFGYAWLKGKSGEGRWTKVLDGVNGEVAVAKTKHRGMADLLVNAERYAWTGTAYAALQPAPAVDLRPRAPVLRAPQQRIPLPSIPPMIIPESGIPEPDTPTPGTVAN